MAEREARVRSDKDGGPREAAFSGAQPGPGTYVLILKSDRLVELQVGALGVLTVQPGYYLYVGSAFGLGGLRSRLEHHLRTALKPHWHLDYLRQEIEIEQAWFSSDQQKREHE